jgi:hypothetical protein
MEETLAPKQTGGMTAPAKAGRVGLFFKPVPLLGYFSGFWPVRSGSSWPAKG